LNATASVPGTFAYTPVLGTVPNAGTQLLSVTFTPTDIVNNSTATATVNLTVNKALSTITWATPAAITYGTALSATQLNATASVPGTFAYTPVLGTVPNAGTQLLSVTFTPTDSVNNSTATATVNLTVNKAASTITWATPAAITYGTALSATQLNATASVPGTFAYTPVLGTVPNAGTQLLSVTFTPTDSVNNSTATATVNLTVNKAVSTITITTPAPSTASFNSQFTVAASAPGGAVVYNSAGGCSNNGPNFLMTSATTACTVFYNQAGDTNYNAAPQVISSTTASKASQSISITNPAPGTAAVNNQFTVAATATGGTVTYSSDSPTVCTHNGAVYTMIATGTCHVQYIQVGNNNYNSAPMLTTSTNVIKADQAINVTTPAPSTASFNSQFTVAASAPGGAVVYNSAGGCSNNGPNFLMTSATTACTVSYNQAGNANYNAAPQVTSSTTATKASQVITVTTPAPATAAFNSQFTVAATAPGGTVVYGSAGGCSNNGAIFTMTSATTACTVSYDQAGSADFSAAPHITSSTAASKSSQVITVTTPAPTTAAFNSQFTVVATAPGGTVVYGSAGGCSNNGATFTMTSGTTACTVSYDQAGNANYNAAPQVTSSTTATKASQVITVTTPAPATAAFNNQFTVAATAPGGTVVYSSAGGCSNNGATFTMTSGTTACAVSYDQAGNSNYNAAAQVTGSTTASKVSQVITVTTPAPTTAAFNSQFTVAATAPGGTVVYGSAGGCSNNGAIFTMTSGTTACTVSYNQAGNTNYNAATQVTSNTTATKATPVITWSTPAAITYGTPLSGVQLNASTSVNGTFAYSPLSGTTPQIGSQTLTVTFTSADSNYANTTKSVVLVVTASASTTMKVGPGFFTTPQAAYDALAQTGGTVLIPAGILTGTPLTASNNVTVTIKGGYDAGFISNSTPPGFTKIPGPVTLKNGKVVFENIKI
jgi:hypothetical protein